MKNTLKMILLVFGIWLTTTILTVATSATNAHGWGFKRNSTHETPLIGNKYEEILKDTQSYYVGDPTKKEIYLTFDVGYDNETLGGILDTLKENQIQATFFLTGDFVKRFPNLVKRIANENHLSANHSYTHLDITNCSKETLKNDLERLNNAYQEVTNKQMSSYFRPPEGRFNKDCLKSLNEWGYQTVFWSIAYRDWVVDDQMSVDETVNSVMDNLHNGAIILMHSVSKSNAKALPIIIQKAKAEGYEFKTVENLKQIQS